MSRVLDRPATLAWIFGDATTPAIRALFDQVADAGAIVPALWRLEVANSPTMAVRRPASMNTLIIRNQPMAQRGAEVVRAWKTGKPEAAAQLDFENLEGAWKLLNAKRWAILRAMAGQGPLAIREIARRVERDVRAVHCDVRAPHLSGGIEQTAEGKMILPYELIRLDFTFATLKAAGRGEAEVPSRPLGGCRPCRHGRHHFLDGHRRPQHVLCAQFRHR